MNELKILIADDERPAREYLKVIFRQIDGVTIIGEAENGLKAVELIRILRPDVVLLDLKMPELGGLEVVRSLKQSETPLVIFATAFDEFAVQAFELNAVDYLLKPVEPHRLREAIVRASERLDLIDWRDRQQVRIGNAEKTIGEYDAQQPIERIPIRDRNDVRLVPVGSIVSIVADGELLHIRTSDGARQTINFRLKDLEARLDPKKFIRVSRGAIVNIDYVETFSLKPGGTYSIHLADGQEITSSRLQSKAIRNHLLKI